MKLIAAAAVAFLIPASIALKARDYTATFDENEPNSGFYGVNITGSYDGLHYTNWTTGPYDYESGFCANVCPQTFPIEAAFDGGKGKQASISSSYANSTVVYFTLKDLYFGCNVEYNGTYEGQHLDFTGPGNCTLTVAVHVDKKLPPTAVQTFKYIPNISQNPNTGAPRAPMTHAVFDASFEQPGIRYVAFSASGPKTGFIFGAEFAQRAPKVLVDNLHYVTYSSK